VKERTEKREHVQPIEKKKPNKRKRQLKIRKKLPAPARSVKKLPDGRVINVVEPVATAPLQVQEAPSEVK